MGVRGATLRSLKDRSGAASVHLEKEAMVSTAIEISRCRDKIFDAACYNMLCEAMRFILVRWNEQFPDFDCDVSLY